MSACEGFVASLFIGRIRLSKKQEERVLGGDRVHSGTLSIDFTAYYGLMPPDGPGEERPALLVALHGWGENYRSMLKKLRPLRERAVLTVAPQGPHQFYLDVSSRKVGFNWLTVYDRDRAIADVNGYLARLIGALKATEVFDDERIFVLGFSQGSAMAYRFCVSGLCRVAGMISVCADMPADVAEALGDVALFPVLLAHGEADPLVGEGVVAHARETLEGHGFAHEAHCFSGGHEITPVLAGYIGGWIGRQGRES